MSNSWDRQKELGLCVWKITFDIDGDGSNITYDNDAYYVTAYSVPHALEILTKKSSDPDLFLANIAKIEKVNKRRAYGDGDNRTYMVLVP